MILCELSGLKTEYLWSAELKPRGVVVSMIPGLVAHLLFMCIRHADYLNDGEKLKSLMHAIITGIKQVTTVRPPDCSLAYIVPSRSAGILH